MFQRAIYIFLSGLWLTVGCVLLFRESLFANWEPTEAQTNRIQWIYAMAFLFAGWNALRYYLYRTSRRPIAYRRRPLRDLSSPPEPEPPTPTP